MTLADFLIDHENHCTSHFETSQFAALFKGERLIRNPVHAFVITRELARIRQKRVAIHDSNATDVCRTDLYNENFGTVFQADLARKAFVDAKKPFDAFDATGVHYTDVKGTATEMADIEASYKHLQAMRDEVISLGVLPAVSEWKKYNPNL